MRSPPEKQGYVNTQLLTLPAVLCVLNGDSVRSISAEWTVAILYFFWVLG